MPLLTVPEPPPPPVVVAMTFPEASTAKTVDERLVRLRPERVDVASICAVPEATRVEPGVVVPMPTFPFERMVIRAMLLVPKARVPVAELEKNFKLSADVPSKPK